MATCGRTRTIEDYADEIFKHLKERNYGQLAQIYETLQKMRNSFKLKHEMNYWKVLQCLGETALDRFVRVIVDNEAVSCRCHTYSNLLSVLQLFNDTLTNVSVIKRSLLYKDFLVPVLLKALRQREDPSLVRQTLVFMYRYLIVGKSELVNIYMKENILKDCFQQIKSRLDIFGMNPIIAILYCGKLMFGMAVHGNSKTRRIVKNSPALRVLGEYVSLIRQETSDADMTFDLFNYFQKVKDTISDEKKALDTAKSWNSKLQLKEDLEQDVNEDMLFCSAPSCRKQYWEALDFRYCGACRLSRYCSADCQKNHWKTGHKEKCLRCPDFEDLK